MDEKDDHIKLDNVNNNLNDDEITPAVRAKDTNKQPPAPLKKKKKI